MKKTVAMFGGSGGLGSAVARRIAPDHPILIGYRSRKEKAVDLAQELSDQGCTAAAAYVDIQKPQSVDEFLNEAARLGDGLSAVVSASGAHFPMCALAEATDTEFRDVVEVELFGTFNILKSAVAHLKKAGGGPIVIFLTTAVLRTMDYDGLNAVPKAAIAMMIRHVAREAGRDNIRVNGIAPGVIDAGLTLSVAQMPALVQQVVADCIRNTPLPRLGRPAEVAALARYLISDDAGYINGQIIGLDGGYST